MSAPSRGLWMRSAAFARAAALLALAAPLYLALAASVTPEAEILRAPPWLPLRPVLEHYRALFAERDFLTPIANSLIVAGATTALAIGLGAPCAYALARGRARGRRAVIAGVLAISMFPQISLVAPLFLLLRAIGWIDTYPGLVLPYVTFAMPLAIWLLLGYFRQLPADIEAAARVDGAGSLRLLVEIVLPLAAPALAATAILTFLYCWNEFLFALSFTIRPERHTVPVAVALFRGQYQVPWGQILAAAVVSSAPVAALVLALQRRIVQGLASGAIKG
jgi:ABC-type glycerol-3-phosphate transport system permease component